MVAYSPDPQPHRVKPNGPGQRGRDEQMSALGRRRTLRLVERKRPLFASAARKRAFRFPPLADIPLPSQSRPAGLRTPARPGPLAIRPAGGRAAGL
jgi:hypothetical protein